MTSRLEVFSYFQIKTSFSQTLLFNLLANRFSSENHSIDHFQLKLSVTELVMNIKNINSKSNFGKAILDMKYIENITTKKYNQ